MLELLLARPIEYLAEQSELRMNGEQTGTKLFDKYLKNGILFRPKEGRSVAVKKNNTIETFYLFMNGYCFLHEILDEDFVFDHESDKYWVIPNPTDSGKISEIFELFQLHGFDYLVKKIESIPDYKDYLTEGIPGMNLTWPATWIYEKYKLLLFNDFSLSRKIYFRNLPIKTFIGNEIKLIENQNSPYLFCSNFSYAYEITDAEDINNIPNKLTITVNARCTNPYIAEVVNTAVLATLDSQVNSIATEIIRKNTLHESSYRVTLQNNNNLVSIGDPPLTPSQVIEHIQQRIKTEMNKSYVGFTINSVDITDIDITGTNAEAIKTASNQVFITQQEQASENIKNLEVNKRKIETAQTNANVLREESKGKADAITTQLQAIATGKSQIGIADAQAANLMIKAAADAGGNLDLAQYALIIERLRPLDTADKQIWEGIINSLKTTTTTTD